MKCLFYELIMCLPNINVANNNNNNNIYVFTPGYVFIIDYIYI